MAYRQFPSLNENSKKKPLYGAGKDYGESDLHLPPIKARMNSKSNNINMKDARLGKTPQMSKRYLSDKFIVENGPFSVSKGYDNSDSFLRRTNVRVDAETVSHKHPRQQEPFRRYLNISEIAQKSSPRCEHVSLVTSTSKRPIKKNFFSARNLNECHGLTIAKAGRHEQQKPVAFSRRKYKPATVTAQKPTFSPIPTSEEFNHLNQDSDKALREFESILVDFMDVPLRYQSPDHGQSNMEDYINDYKKLNAKAKEERIDEIISDWLESTISQISFNSGPLDNVCLDAFKSRSEDVYQRGESRASLSNVNVSGPRMWVTRLQELFTRANSDNRSYICEDDLEIIPDEEVLVRRRNGICLESDKSLEKALELLHLKVIVDSLLEHGLL